MSVEQVGPGGVSNSYGVRTTTSKVVYENDNTYQDVFISTGTLPIVADESTGKPILESPTTTTVGSAGAASALPATPELYMSVNVNGIDLKIPLYKE